MLTALQESFWDRLGGVIALQRRAYEALQQDATATAQALLIVIFLGLANGIAVITTPVVTAVPGMTNEIARDLQAVLTFDTTERQLLALLAGVGGAIVSWYLSAWLLCFIGNRLAASEQAKVGGEEMRRLVGWGYAPSLAAFLTPIPVIGPLLATIGAFWALVTGIMAVRVAFNVGIGKAIAIEIAAFLIVLVVVTAIALVALMIAWPAA
jgi:hypothetical protein